MVDPQRFPHHKVDGLVRYCSISTANALEILQSCTEPLIGYPMASHLADTFDLSNRLVHIQHQTITQIYSSKDSCWLFPRKINQAHINLHWLQLCFYKRWIIFQLQDWFTGIWEQCSVKIKMKTSQIAKFMGPTWGPPGACRPQMAPMLAPWTLLSGILHH